MTCSIGHRGSNRSMPSSSRWSPVATAMRSSDTCSTSIRWRFSASTVTSWFFFCAWNRTMGRMPPGSPCATAASSARLATAPFTAFCHVSFSDRMTGSLIISSRFNSCARTLYRMLDLGRGVAVNSTMAHGLTRVCISRVRPVTALCASSTIISGRCRCSRLANENLTPPPFNRSSPGSGAGTAEKCGSRSSWWAYTLRPSVLVTRKVWMVPTTRQQWSRRSCGRTWAKSAMSNTRTRPPNASSSASRYGCPAFLSASAVCRRMVVVGASHSTSGQSFSIHASRATRTACAPRIVLPPPVGSRRQT